MREVRVTVPEGRSADVARVARAVGIEQVTVYQVYVHGPDAPREVVSAETSTPTAKTFLDALVAEPLYDPAEWSITSRSVRAIAAGHDLAELTRPVVQPAEEVCQDLWQASHVTASFVGRVFVATALLAYGMLQNSLTLLIVALLFTQFLPPLLATALGLKACQWRLALRGALAFAAGVGLGVAAGAAVALLAGGPLRFEDFGTPATNLLISLAVGVAAGLATADDVGERQLIGLAAAAQLAKFPVWFGIALVLGFPDADTTLMRLGLFGMNAAALVGAIYTTYAALGLRPGRARPASAPAPAAAAGPTTADRP
jgi:hypothetical protein